MGAASKRSGFASVEEDRLRCKAKLIPEFARAVKVQTASVG